MAVSKVLCLCLGQILERWLDSCRGARIRLNICRSFDFSASVCRSATYCSRDSSMTSDLLRSWLILFPTLLVADSSLSVFVESTTSDLLF